MTDLYIRPDTVSKLGRVEGGLKVGKNARIEAEDGQKVTVSGNVRFLGDAEILSSFECDSLSVEAGFLGRAGGGQLRVRGDLVVHGRLDVNHSVAAGGEIRAEDVDVGGTIRAGSLSSKRVRVGGVVEVKRTVQAEVIEVGGKFLIPGTVRARDLGVGGVAEIGGGALTGSIKVGGKFTSAGKLEFGELQVYGICSLEEGGKGNRLSTFGKLSVEGDLGCEQVQVMGVTKINGNCNARRMEVNGKLVVSRSLNISDRIESYGATEILGELTGANLRVGGKFSAKSVILSGEADLSGHVKTTNGLRAKEVNVRGGTRCEGALVGERIEIGRSGRTVWNETWSMNWAGQNAQIRARIMWRPAHVEDVYGSDVFLGGNGTRARDIHGHTVELAEGSIANRVSYTDELRRGSHAYTVAPPQKVARLPDPPL